MSDLEDQQPEQDGDDVLAAEYVLGAMSATERADATRRIDRDAAFARLVDQWEVRLASMAEAYPEIAPPDRVRQAVDLQLGHRARTSRQASGLWHSLALWRGLAAAAFAVLVLMIGATWLGAPPQAPAPMRLAATMGADGSPVSYMAVYDAQSGEIGMSHMAGDRGAGRDFELWMIEGDKPPVSMGVIPHGASVRIAVAEPMRPHMASGVVFAISDEPQGGSTTGQPSGPVVAAGDLRVI